MKTSRSPVVQQQPSFSSTYLLDHVVSHFTGETTLNQVFFSSFFLFFLNCIWIFVNFSHFVLFFFVFFFF